MNRYSVLPVERFTKWVDGKESMTFKRTRGVKKQIRKRGNAAVNLLKQMKWLKPTQIQLEYTKTITVDWERLDNFIIRHCHEILRNYNRDGLTLVMGCGEFEKLMKCDHLNMMMRFDLSVVGTRQFRGMTVVLLPWMDGFVCVPREYLPIETKTTIKEVPESEATKKLN